MNRFGRIASATFGATNLPLPLSVKLSRRAEANSIGGDNDAFVTSVQLAGTSMAAELRIRGTAVAEGLSLGQQATLTCTLTPASSGQSGRTITLSGAVLVGIDLDYEQTSMATATLRFLAESAGADSDPFAAEDSQ